MTSMERREARYQRRKAARQKNREEKLHEALDFDKVFTFAHMYHAAQRCFRNVRWKASVQVFRSKCGILVAKRLRELRAGVFKLRKSPEFYTRERGHERRINSIHIEDRVPQKCMCMYSLKPVLHRTLIYDNYASQEGKGTEKARNRVKAMLERHIRKYGLTGGLILFDFKGFFDSVQHKLVRYVLDRHYSDKRIIGMNMRIVKQAREKVGLILGSENSQDFAIATPSMFDHFIMEVLRVDGYGRYMDDGVIIHHSLTYLKSVWERIKHFASRLGFTLNEKKSRIIRFGKSFTTLKRKYSFSASGQIIVRPVQASVIRARRKIKKLYSRYLGGTMRLTAGADSLRSWESSLRGCRCWRITRSIEQLYDRLYIENWLCGYEEESLCSTKSFQAAA